VGKKMALPPLVLYFATFFSKINSIYWFDFKPQLMEPLQNYPQLTFPFVFFSYLAYNLYFWFFLFYYSKTSITEHLSFMNNLLQWTPSEIPERILLVLNPSFMNTPSFWMWTHFYGPDCMYWLRQCEHIKRKR
jgi:hypothetical protein